MPPRFTQDKNGKDYFTSGADVMLKDDLELLPENAAAGSKRERLKRYEVVHVIGIDETDDVVRFQKIRHGAKHHGITDDQPVFALPFGQLKRHLRAKSEPVAAMIEGMALVKPFEYILRHGKVKIDVPARRQFKQDLPIVRRVKLGPIQILITYDPKVVYGGKPREIVLTDFDGRRGLTLRLPADGQTRVFVLRSRSRGTALPMKPAN